MIDPNGTKIDIVPFGAIEDKASNIQWPPKGGIEMSVLGFKEAYEHPINVIIQKAPLIEIPVATSQGLGLLKLIAWSNRDKSLRKKDAQDFAYLLGTYEKTNEVMKRIYDTDKLMEQYDWDISLASAHLLGLDSASIAKKLTQTKIDLFSLDMLVNMLASMGDEVEIKIKAA